jgi:hypothetical protein
MPSRAAPSRARPCRAMSSRPDLLLHQRPDGNPAPPAVTLMRLLRVDARDRRGGRGPSPCRLRQKRTGGTRRAVAARGRRSRGPGDLGTRRQHVEREDAGDDRHLRVPGPGLRQDGLALPARHSADRAAAHTATITRARSPAGWDRAAGTSLYTSGGSRSASRATPPSPLSVCMAREVYQSAAVRVHFAAPRRVTRRRSRSGDRRLRVGLIAPIAAGARWPAVACDGRGRKRQDGERVVSRAWYRAARRGIGVARRAHARSPGTLRQQCAAPSWRLCRVGGSACRAAAPAGT